MRKFLFAIAMLCSVGAQAATYPATYNVIFGSGAVGSPCPLNIDYPGECQSYSDSLDTACKGIIPFREVDESLNGRDPGNAPFTATSAIGASGVSCTVWTRSGQDTNNLAHSPYLNVQVTCGAPMGPTYSGPTPTFTAYVGYTCTGNGSSPGTGTKPLNAGEPVPDCRFWVFSCYFKSPRGSLETSTMIAGATGSFTDNTYTFVATSPSVYLEADGVYQDGTDGTNIASISTSPSLGGDSCSNNSCVLSVGTATPGTLYTVTVTGSTTGAVNSHAYMLQTPYSSWTAWTPTLTPNGTGTWTTSNVQGTYQQTGNQTCFQLTFYVSAYSVGNSGSWFTFGLPTVPTSTSSATIVGKQTSNSNFLLGYTQTNGQGAVVDHDASTLGTAPFWIVVSGCYF